MGLLTDIFFINAIKSNEELMAKLPAGDVYNNVASPDYDMENVPLPYIIVNNDGGSNDRGTKDDMYESNEDTVNISIRIVGRSRKELADMTMEVRRTVRDYMIEADRRIEDGRAEDGDELKPCDYTFSFSDISYDMNKPAHVQMFYYACITDNEVIND